MTKRFIVLVMLLCCSFLPAFAQEGGPARRVRSGASLPATCSSGTSGVDIFILTSGGASVEGEYYCKAGVWTKDGAAPTPAATPAGSNGQIQYNNAGAFGGISSSGTGSVIRQTTLDLKQDLLTNSAGLRGALSDETGTGAAVFGTAPTIAGATFSGDAAFGTNKVTFSQGLIKSMSTSVIGLRNTADSGYVTWATGKLWVRADNDDLKFTVGQLDAYSVEMTSAGSINWSTSGTQANTTKSLGLKWSAAGVLKITDGLSGYGSLDAGSVKLNNTVTWTAGAGAPSGACVTGSFYSRTDGGAGSTWYVCESTAWVAK